MKTKVLFTAFLLLAIFLQAKSDDSKQAATEKNQIRLFTTNSANDLTQRLTGRYEQENPGAIFKIYDPSKQINQEQFQAADLRIVSESDIPLNNTNEINYIIIGREIFVPVVNSGNPFLNQITKQGIQAPQIAPAFAGKQVLWETLTGQSSGSASPVHFYIADDENLTNAVAGFLKAFPASFSGSKLAAAVLVEKVQTDPFAIAFFRLTDIEQLSTENKLPENLLLMPIDRNENGRLDYNENFYANIEAFKRGVWIGKFPQQLVSNIYAAENAKNQNQLVTDFLNWIVTDGQELMHSSGITELVYNERPMKLEKINQAEIPVNTAATGKGKSFLVLFISLLAATAGFVGFIYYFRTGKVKNVVLQAVPQLQKTLNEQTFEIPGGLFFDKSHTWIFMEKDGQVKIGVDDFIPKVTGKLTRVIMKKPGDPVKRREPVVQLIQQGKHINIYSPVSGTITDFNEDLVTSPENINGSPYENGWIYQIKPSNWLRETDFFKLGSQYQEWIQSELARLKDFLACSHNLQLTPNVTVAFQEGGEIAAQPLKEMSPKVWDDFQTYFIDTADLY